MSIAKAIGKILKLGQTGGRSNVTAVPSFHRAPLQQFISSVVHDIRNPLTTVQTLCELSLQKEDDSQFQLRAFRQIHQETLRIERLLGDLVAASRGNSGWRLALGWVCLAELSRELLAKFQADYPDIEFRLDISAKRTLVLADRDRLTQVIMNLVQNAVKYSGDRAEVEIRVGADSLEVLDRGIGIPPDKQLRIFEPFTRLEPARELCDGAGLGLSIVREIMDAHGGNVSVQARDGGGTVFRIDFAEATKAG